jgi:hypothetical protein
MTHPPGQEHREHPRNHERLGPAAAAGALVGAAMVALGVPVTARLLAIAVAVAGVLIFVFSPTAPLAFAGVLLWGVGACLGFPVGMSAAADDPAAAAGRVGVVAVVVVLAWPRWSLAPCVQPDQPREEVE